MNDGHPGFICHQCRLQSDKHQALSSAWDEIHVQERNTGEIISPEKWVWDECFKNLVWSIPTANSGLKYKDN